MQHIMDFPIPSIQTGFSCTFTGFSYFFPFFFPLILKFAVHEQECNDTVIRKMTPALKRPKVDIPAIEMQLCGS